MNQTLRKFIFFLLLSPFLLCLISTASASIYYSNPYNQIYIKGENANLTNIYNSLSPIYGESMISYKGEGLWYLNATLTVKNNSCLILDSSEVTELRLSDTPTSYNVRMEKGSKCLINGVQLKGWNNTTDSYASFKTGDRKNVCLYNASIKNSTFQYFNSIEIHDTNDTKLNEITISQCDLFFDVINCNNITLDSLYFKNQGYGLVTDYVYNSTIKNIKFEHMTDPDDINKKRYWGSSHRHTNYCMFENLTYDYIGDGMCFSQGSEHNRGNNIYINGSTWNGFAPDDYGYWTNMTVKNANHNGIDTHNNHDLVFENIYVETPKYEAILITAGYWYSPKSYNVTFRNVHIKDGNIKAQDNASDLWFENIYMEGPRDDIGISAENVTLINVTQATNDSSLTLFTHNGLSAINVSAIDLSFHLLDANTTDGKLINCRFNNAYHRNITPYYYVDSTVVNSEGIPVNLASLSIENEVDQKVSSLTGIGQLASNFRIGLGGKTASPTVDRRVVPVIASCNGMGTVYTHTMIFRDSTGNSTVLEGITPDSSWYRKDPNVPTYTITAIIPDSSSKGTHITGFAPSTENPFNPGEKKNFRVWADGNLTGIKWTIDGVTVAEGALNYTWTVSENVSTIEFSGIGADGAVVNQVWNFRNDYPRWDVNKDYTVNFTDINLIAQNYGTFKKEPCLDWDVNQNGTVDLDDLLITEENFGKRYDKK